MSDDTFEKWFKVLMVVAVVILVAFASTLIWAIVKVILHYT